MSQLQTLITQILNRRLTYRKLTYLKRNLHVKGLQNPHCRSHGILVCDNFYTNRFLNLKYYTRVTSKNYEDSDGNVSEAYLDKTNRLDNSRTQGIYERNLGYEFQDRQSNFQMYNTYDRQQTQKPLKRLSSHKNNTKLHNRRLTVEENVENSIDEFVKDLDEHDQFGMHQSKGETTVSEKRYRFNERHYHNQYRQSRSKSYAKTCSEEQTNDDIWKDSFGTLISETEKHSSEKSFTDDIDDEKPHFRLAKKGRRYDPKWYAKKIEEFGKQGKVKDAIEVLEVWMLQNDRVMPTNFVISHLLTILAKAGYTKKAFQIFNRMKKLGIEPNEYIYSALFNACANSPWPEDGLNRAKSLLELMGTKNVTPNTTVFNSMIKGFAFCGDARTAFLLADKLGKNEKLSAETYSHILMAAISDKNAGFWLAVQVWRWMLIKRVQPDIQLYNLMLRVIRECQVSSHDLTKQLLLPINPATTIKYFKAERSKAEGSTELNNERDIQAALPFKETNEIMHSDNVPSGKETSQDTTEYDSSLSDDQTSSASDGDNSLSINMNTSLSASEAVVTDIDLPNVLKINQNYSHIVAVGEISTPQDRFAMVGGITGYLADMESNGVKPNIETFDQMLSLIHPEEEDKLLSVMRFKRVKPDIDLLTSLMYKRCLRKDYSSAKEVLDLIACHKLVPNMRTYCTLALTCVSYKDGKQLLQNIKSADIIPDIKVFGALVRTSGLNFRYKMMLLKEMEENDIKPDFKLLQTIENQIKIARKIIHKKERAGKYDQWLDSNFEEFKVVYEKWLERVELDIPDHPWASFREKKIIHDK